MGNRAFITLIDNSNKQTYYTHWNGGPDTWLSIFNAVKLAQVSNLASVLDAWEKVLGRKLEPVTVDRFEEEENGHFTLNLSTQVMTHLKSGKVTTIVEPHRHFTEYVNQKIKPDFREKVIESYWMTLQEQFLAQFQASPTSKEGA